MSEFFYEHKTNLLRILNNLEDFGVVIFSGSKKAEVSLEKSFDLPEVHSVSIELKLYDWQKALWQAARNLCQFSSSYVIMPSHRVDILGKNSNLFSSNQIGTAIFDVDTLEVRPINTTKTLKTNKYDKHYIATLNTLVENITEFSPVT